MVWLSSYLLVQEVSSFFLLLSINVNIELPPVVPGLYATLYKPKFVLDRLSRDYLYIHKIWISQQFGQYRQYTKSTRDHCLVRPKIKLKINLQITHNNKTTCFSLPSTKTFWNYLDYGRSFIRLIWNLAMHPYYCEQ